MKKPLFIFLVISILSGCSGAKYYSLRLQPAHTTPLRIKHTIYIPDEELTCDTEMNIELLPSESGAEIRISRITFTKLSKKTKSENGHDCSEIIPLTGRIFADFRRLYPDAYKPDVKKEKKPDTEHEEEKSDSEPTIAAAAGIGNALIDPITDAVSEMMLEFQTIIIPYSARWLPDRKISIGSEWNVDWNPQEIFPKALSGKNISIHLKLVKVDLDIAVIKGKVVEIKPPNNDGQSSIILKENMPVLIEWNLADNILKKLRIGDKKPYIEVIWLPVK